MATQTQPTPSSAPPQPLSFPPSHFAKLAPKSYLHAHLSSPSSRRPSGRLPHESRKQHINTGSLTHCHGSAVVRTGDTAVVCGIRGEILNASDIIDHRPLSTPAELETRYGAGNPTLASIPHNAAERARQARREDAEEMAYLNLLVPNVELSTGCSPSYLPGAAPSTEAQSLSHRVLTLLHTSQLLSMDNLRIWYHPPHLEDLPQEEEEPPPSNPSEHPPQPNIKAYWTLHITLLVLSLSGPAFPTLWTALLAALRNTVLPNAWWDGDTSSVLCSPLHSESSALALNGFPVATSFGVFWDAGAGLRDEGGRGKWVLVDIDGFEEGCCEERVTVVVRGVEGGIGMEILRIEKGGGGVVGRREMREIVEVAGERWGVVRGAIDGGGG
ncbi:MAG: hypothetical protein Q9182_007160 [Xanthomendoza sp. 2 TL-2023]